jgi:DNA-binding MarR family transcriptional regulator
MSPPLDPGPLDGFVGYRLRVAQLRNFEDFTVALQNVALTPAQFSALLMVAHNPGLAQGELAAALGIQRTNFVAFATRLQKRGLIERRRAGGDRRAYELLLTDAGRTLLDRALALHAQFEARLAEKLGPGGKAQLLDLLGRLTR